MGETWELLPASPRASALLSRPAANPGRWLVVVPALEEFALRVGAAPHVREKVENLLARELVEQSLRHERRGCLLHLRDVRLLDLHRLGARQRVLDHLHDAVLLLHD